MFGGDGLAAVSHPYYCTLVFAMTMERPELQLDVVAVTCMRGIRVFDLHILQSACGCCQFVELVFYDVLRSYVCVRCMLRMGSWHL